MRARSLFLAAAAFFLSAPGTSQAPTVAVTGAPSPALARDSADTAHAGGSPSGFNLAAAALGGRIESFTSQENESTWAAANLIDGITFRYGGRGCRLTCGWAAADWSFPQDIVISFHEGRKARVHAIELGTASLRTTYGGDYLKALPREVEVWTSETTDGEFELVATAEIEMAAGDHPIFFDPVTARRVKVRILSNRGKGRVHLGELRVYEAPIGSSIVADLPRNLALPALGGAIVRFTSRNAHNTLGEVINGRALIDESSWASRTGDLPQDIVFAFRRDELAWIDRVTVHPANSHKPATWVRTVSVALARDDPASGFEEIGEISIAQEDPSQTLAIDRAARFVRLRVIENHGGGHTTLGEVEIWEGNRDGYTSVLARGAENGAGEKAEVEAAMTGALVEQEPNDTPQRANPLVNDRWTRGRIEPLGETDYFKLRVPADGILNLDLLGRPHLRTSVALHDPSGRLLKSFDPARAARDRTALTWKIPAGEHLVEVSEPPITMVVVWDASESMDESTDDLERAVTSFLKRVRPGERVQLLRFGSPWRAEEPDELLLEDFSDDPETLLAATEGQFIAAGGTPFYAAVARALDLLREVEGNKAIVVMTDGRDTASRGFRDRLDHAAFWRLLTQSHVRLYTVGLGAELLGYQPQLGTSGRRFLTHAALATGGRSFFAGRGDELGGLYQEISGDLRSVSSYALRPRLAAGYGTVRVVASEVRRPEAMKPPLQIALILDASGSMRERGKLVDGRLKMDVAKEVLSRLVAEDLPPEARVALRVYGRRIHEGDPGDCEDTELLVPFSPLDRDRLLETISSLEALGTTPLAYALRQVATDFGDASGEKVVILVTDGKEECGGDPSQVVAELQAQGLELRLEVVGFALAEEAVKQEMRRVAAIGGGHFFDATDAQELREAVGSAVSVPYDVLDAAGERVATGVAGSPLRLPTGSYELVVHGEGTVLRIPDVRILANSEQTIELQKQGEQISFRILGD